MTIEAFPPGLVLILAAPLLALLAAGARTGVLVLAPLLALAATWTVGDGAAVTVPFLKYEVVLVAGSDAARLFASVVLACVLGLGVAGPALATRELVAAYLGTGLALGVVFAGDLIAVWLQWELLALAATALIWSAGTEAARAAGLRFLIMQLLGGFLFKAGMDGAYAANGSYLLQPMSLEAPLLWALVGGALVKAAAWPLAAWLPDAWRHASAGACAWLSLLLPASAIYLMLMLFSGNAPLLWAGLVMLAYGLAYALLQSRSRLALAYALVAWAGLSLLLTAIQPALAAWVVLAQPIVFATGFALLARAGQESERRPLLAFGPRDPVDTDWLWRVALFGAGRGAIEVLAAARAAVERAALATLGNGGSWLARLASGSGVLARSWGIGLTSLWVAVLLVLYIVVYLL